MDKLLSVLNELLTCYYSSAARDYSDLPRISQEIFYPGNKQQYELPSFYVHRDYYPWENKLAISPGQVLYDDIKGKITVKSVEEIPRNDVIPLSVEQVDFSEEMAEYRKKILMELEVDLKNGRKPARTKLLYCLDEY